MKPAQQASDAVALARTRSRRRLVGALVLLGIGIIAFPLVFETQPRPVAVNIPIEIPKRETAAPLTPPAAPPAAQASVPAPGAEAPVAREAAPPPVAAVPAPAAPPAASRVAEAKPMPAAAPRHEPKAPPPPPAASEAGRFIVQVGAFADAAAARETRQKVEKLGLKTYTQVAETASGNRTRVRIGPFASREEAEKALARAKAAGIDGVVLTL